MEPDYKCEKQYWRRWYGIIGCGRKAKFLVIAESPRTGKHESFDLCGTHKNQLLRTYDPDATVTELDQ